MFQNQRDPHDNQIGPWNGKFLEHNQQKKEVGVANCYDKGKIINDKVNHSQAVYSDEIMILELTII